jgi:hypothetical protein
MILKLARASYELAIGSFVLWFASAQIVAATPIIVSVPLVWAFGEVLMRNQK